MTTDPVLLAVSHWEVIVGFCVSALFPLVILRWWRWYQSTWGWNTILLEVSIAATLLPSVIFRVFGIADEFLQWTAVICFGLVILNVIWRTVIIRKTQIEETKADHAAARARARDIARASADEPE